MSSGDPNGWVSNTSITFCKIHGTSRDTMNGSFARVVYWNGTRYTVQLTSSNQQVALKPDNLQKAGYLDTAKAYYEFFQNDPQVRAQWDQMQRTVVSRTGYSIRTIALAVVVSLIVLTFLLKSFVRVWITMTVAALVVYLAAPSSSGQEPLATRAASRWRYLLTSSELPIPAVVLQHRYGLPVVTAVLAGLVTLAWITAGGSSTTAAGAAGPISDADAEYYYKLGFTDGTEARPFGTSMVKTPPEDMDDDTPWDVGPTRRTSSSSRSPWSSALKVVPMALLGQRVYRLGSTGDGGWDYRLALANFQNLDMMSKGMLAFGVYHVISSFR